MKLLTGQGQEVTAQYDADFFAGFLGSATCVLGTGNKFSAQIINNNLVRVSDGVGAKEGRVFSIPQNSFDDFSVPNGTSGSRGAYYLGYRIYTSGNDELIEKAVSRTMTASGSMRDGNSEMYIWLYQANQNGVVLESLTPLFTELTPLGMMPAFRSGYADPDDSIGKDGDFYFKIIG